MLAVFPSIVSSLAASTIWQLPSALAGLPSVSFTQATRMVKITHTVGGVSVLCSDGYTRTCRWSTIAKHRGQVAALRAKAFFATWLENDYDPESWRFVTCGTDRNGARWSKNEWFVAIVKV